MTGGDTGNDCDEYPYYATKEGYPKSVFLSPVDLYDNRRACSYFSSLVVGCGVGQGGEFGVLPDTSRPVSIVACRQ